MIRYGQGYVISDNVSWLEHQCQEQVFQEPQWLEPEWQEPEWQEQVFQEPEWLEHRLEIEVDHPANFDEFDGHFGLDAQLMKTHL